MQDSGRITVENTKLLLKLGEAGRDTLLIMLDQFQGKNQGVLDRSQMNPAQKQKLKRGIAELTSSNIITKIFHSQSSYKINPNILCVISHKQTLSYLINNSVKGIRHTHFLILLTAIEEFFYDFYHTPAEFLIKGKTQLKVPADLFSRTVKATKPDPKLFFVYQKPSLLTRLIHLQGYMNFIQISDGRGYPDKELQDFLEYFKETLLKSNWQLCSEVTDAYVKREMEPLRAHAYEWFSTRVPEYLL